MQFLFVNWWCTLRTLQQKKKTTKPLTKSFRIAGYKLIKCKRRDRHVHLVAALHLLLFRSPYLLKSLTSSGFATHCNVFFCFSRSRMSRWFHSNRHFNSYSMSNFKLKYTTKENVHCFEFLSKQKRCFCWNSTLFFSLFAASVLKTVCIL